MRTPVKEPIEARFEKDDDVAMKRFVAVILLLVLVILVVC